MSRTNSNKQEQKIKTSIWAKASFFCAVLGWLILIVALTVVVVPDNKVFDRIIIGLMTLALVTGIVGILEIVRGKGTVKGLSIIVISLLAVLLFLFCLWMP